MEVEYIQEPLYRMDWQEIEKICRDIAVEASKSFGPDLVVGVAKGGLIPATMIASILRIDLFPCVVTRKRHGEIISDRPEIIIPVNERVADRRVLIVDESVVTGQTMLLVSAQCKKLNARIVKTACIWAFVESWKPTWYGLETAGHIMFPWDYEVLSRGKFILNPIYREYIDAMENDYR
jgi:hypoxanthine phosphoribosyltransferase